MKHLLIALSVVSLACGLQSSLPRGNVQPKVAIVEPTTVPACRKFVTAEHLNLRTAAGTGYEVLAVLDRGQQIHARLFRAGWWLVDTEIDGKVVTGWVRDGYISTCP